MRKTLLVLGGLGVLYALVELASFLILAHVHRTDVNAFAASVDRYYARLGDDDLREFLDGPYHPELGWDNQPGVSKTEKNCIGEEWTISYDEDGARSVPEPFATTLIAAYGDSYIRGGEINDDQAWTYQLSKEIGMGARNYGVGAYGTYQAALKAKAHIEQGMVYPVTGLGVNEENIRRVLNLFRPFLSQRGQMKFAFLPGVHCVEGNCSAVDNPLRPDVQTVREVKQIAREAARLDYWARLKPAFEYPWSWNLLKLARLALGRGRANEREPLWNDRDGVAAMRLVIENFREAVAAAGSIPVVLFFPQRPKAGVAPSYSQFKHRLAAEFPDLRILDVAESEFDPRRFKLKPTACHPSAYGHSVIAETVRRGLSDIIDATHASVQAGDPAITGMAQSAEISGSEARK